ncbi:MAG: putative Zn-dependent peptidase [Patescibacteria group bacterium]|jgi:predicted Zn-dependent peptidase
MVEFNRKVLANGLTVIHEKRDVSVTTVMMSVRYGAMFESAEDKGVAHFIEHLCFKGTAKRNAEEISSTLEKIGGELNAFTHEEMTAYHVRLPSAKLELGIDVISDIFFNPIFPVEDVEKERNVILEEIKMYHDNPRSHVMEGLKNNLFASPFGLFTAGTPDTLAKMDRDFLLARHDDIYIPANSVLCVVGNNTFEEVINLAEKYIVVDRKGERIDESLNIVSALLHTDEERADVQQSNVAIGISYGKLTEKEEVALEVFNAIFGEGMSSKLFLEVREKRGLVYGVHSHLDIGRNYAYMIIGAGTDSSKVKEVVRICLEEYSKMGSISEDELSEAKEQVIGSHIVGSEASNETAVALIMEEFCGRVEDYYKYEEKVKNVTMEDIVAIAQRTEYASFILGPKA